MSPLTPAASPETESETGPVNAPRPRDGDRHRAARALRDREGGGRGDAESTRGNAGSGASAPGSPLLPHAADEARRTTAIARRMPAVPWNTKR